MLDVGRGSIYCCIRLSGERTSDSDGVQMVYVISVYVISVFIE